jgi:glycerol-3-phosphate acyltransferase PlsY
MLYILSVVFILLAYLSGSIPVGYWVARAYGVDVTASGSGRTGGTNVLRAAGPWAAAFTVAGDMLKGLIPVYLLVSAGFPPLVPALAANAAVLGHNYSIFLGFRGGVGAGTAIGAMAGLSFPIALVAGACGIIGLVTTRYASILSSSIAVGGLIGFIVAALLGYTPYEYIVFGVINVIMIFYALRPNFARIRVGTERKVGQKTENITKIHPDKELS